MIIITGASTNHYLTLQNMMDSYINFMSTSKYTLIVYDLGMETNQWKNLLEKYQNRKDILFKVFDYSKYPEWYNIKIEAGQYAWKPAIIKEISLEYSNEILLWMDAGNILLSNLEQLEEYIHCSGVYSSVSLGNISRLTFPTTIEYMNCTWTDARNRNGACLGFNMKDDKVKSFLREYCKYCSIKECIAPEGSSRANHRQDQSVFTILFYKYGYAYDINGWTNIIGNYCIGFSIHNDVD
jgi:hypothetical protein